MCVRFVRGDGTGREGVVKSLAWRPLREERLAEGARVEAQRDRVEAHAAQLAACARGRAVGGVRAASCYMLPSACYMLHARPQSQNQVRVITTTPLSLPAC